MEIKVLTESEVSRDFLQAMASRMEFSFCKYGPVMASMGKVDEIKSLKMRLEKYESTGNTEWLVDVANFAMIEFMHRGSDAFRATGSEESPGLTLTDGRVSHSRHTPIRATVADTFYRSQE